ncbi:hypothetical protein B6C83_07270 [Aerococcus urinae]|nr:hypothetical protein AWM73_08815 [Aerococcus urinae]ORE68467.1 hypothetical protein B6C83_07270 [Aerococcus urinae]RAV65691.1 hypothetical protein DBT42_06425 [Aerococcus urinae]
MTSAIRGETIGRSAPKILKEDLQGLLKWSSPRAWNRFGESVTVTQKDKIGGLVFKNKHKKSRACARLC